MNFRDQASLAVTIGALLVSGCGGSSDQAAAHNTASAGIASTPPVLVSPATPAPDAGAAKATVQMAVRFPSDEASAAWIGDVDSIQVHFYQASVADWGQAQQIRNVYLECQEAGTGINSSACDDIAADSLKGDLAGTLTLTSDGSTGYLDLDPGYYRVEAAFMDASGALRETSVSYASLGSGAHTLRLKGMSADWQFDAAVTPVLLGGTSAMALEADWDPVTEGVQSPLQVMGLVGRQLTGIQLPSAAANWPAERDLLNMSYGQQAALQAGLMDDELSTDEVDNSSWFLPILTVADSDSGTEDSLNIQFAANEEMDASATFADTDAIEYEQFDLESAPAFLRQSYVSGYNSVELDLGGRSVSFVRTYISAVDGEVLGYSGAGAELLFGVPSTASGPVYEMTNLQPGTDRYWGTDGWTAAPTMSIATIDTDISADNAWLDVFVGLQGTVNQVVDGSHIAGYLIEHLYQFEARSVDGNSDLAPTPTAYLDASLNAIAQAEGLVAQPAADSGCSSYSNASASSFSNEYLWDDSTQRWVAGTFNSLLQNNSIMNEIDARIADLRAAQLQYAPGGASENADVYAIYESVIHDHDVTYRETVLAMADFNGDGVASLFEEGVYIAEGVTPACWLTSETVDGLTYYGMDCYDITAVPTAPSLATSVSGSVCVQPFTATASALVPVSQ